MRVEQWINGRWTEVEVPANFFSDWTPEEEEPKRRRPPTYRVYAIRRPGPIDEKAGAAVLDWLRGSHSP